MIHGYHVILPMYGFWLPNDPRGSWSTFVRKWEIARHSYKVEQIANLLKEASTSRIIEDGRHPLAIFAEAGRRPPRMWAAKMWKVYLDSEDAIESAIRYVEENPEKEGKQKQGWSFVTPFAGIPKSGWTTYH